MHNEVCNYHFLNVNHAVVSAGRSTTHCPCTEQGYKPSRVLFLALCHFLSPVISSKCLGGWPSSHWSQWDPFYCFQWDMDQALNFVSIYRLHTANNTAVSSLVLKSQVTTLKNMKEISHQRKPSKSPKLQPAGIKVGFTSLIFSQEGQI